MSTDLQYADTGDGAHVAYEVGGAGPLEVLAVLAHGISIGDQKGGRHCREFIGRLERFARVVRFDRRGMGLSDPVPRFDDGSLDLWADDAIAVLDRVGMERVSIVSVDSTACMISLMLAATRPDRFGALVLFNPSARWLRAADYTEGFDPEQMAATIDAVVQFRLTGARPAIPLPSVDADVEFQRWWLLASRRGLSPATTRQLYEFGARTDVRSVLGVIRVPTLVIRRSGVPTAAMAARVAAGIPGARLVDVPGDDALAYVGDTGPILQEVQTFLTGRRPEPEHDRVLATVLFTDVVDSTAHGSRLGDRAWSEKMNAHDAVVREQLDRHRGREIKSLGDGFLATFDGPARAIRCALAIVETTTELGLAVRAGLHTGEIEIQGEDIRGVSVNIAARIAALAAAREVLVSRTVVDLVVGAGLSFSDRGERRLRGVEGAWRLFACDPRPR